MTNLPASSTQRRLWLLDRLRPGSATYHIAWAVELTGPLDVAALNRALTWLVARHEALRTRFVAVDGEPTQVVADPAPVALRPVAAGADWPAHVDRAARAPFDLATGPLARWELLAVEPHRHVLSAVVHHTVADGWSFAVLFAELADAYAAAVAGTDPDLPPPPVQYGDFAIWQRERDAAGDLDADLAFWVDELAGAPTLLDLPTDRPRPPEESDSGGEVVFAIPDDLADRLRARGEPLFVPLLAGFQTLLHRIGGQSDLLVAVPVAARTRPETQDVVGFFANTLALRARFGAGTTFADTLAAARTSATAARERQDVPFDRLVDRLATGRSLARSPLVQVMFAVDRPPGARTAAGVTFAPTLWENGTVKFDLTLTVDDRPDRLGGRLTYRTDLFDRLRVERLGHQYVTLLRAALDRPDAPVAALPLLDAADRHRILVDWNDSARPQPTAGDITMPAPPGAIAVVDADGPTTYGELTARAHRIAHLLRRHGVGPDVPVALHLRRSRDLVAAILGVWRAGGGYLPLDPSLPAARLATMVRDARPPVLLSDLPLPPGLDAPTVLGLDAADRESVHPPAVAVHPAGLAYLLYTSGSTGTPKGVAVTHGGVANLLGGCLDAFGFTAADRVAAITTAAFDISVVELVLPLLAGARIELIDADTARDAGALRTALADRGVTVAQGTPATWRMLVTAGGVPAAVRLRITGGEALTRDLADALTADGATLVNGYGPSETTVYSSTGPVGPAVTVDLGAPVANTRLYLLDPAGEPVPEGAIGEVHIGGSGVARGYHGRPRLTADRFRPDPFGPAGGRLYATGDLARWLPTGRLDYVGRADHQVKVRGFRIELGEIEAALRDDPRLADAVVTTWGDGPDIRIAAYGVPTEPAAAADLWPGVRAGLARRLPDYMVPATLVRLDALPRTGSGKVDRRALPEPTWRESAAAPARPRTDVEEKLAALWREVLGVPEVGVTDNFFALGGHSLTATRLLARIRAVFGVDVPLRNLFTAPTIAGLAPLVGGAGPTDHIGPSGPTPDLSLVSLDDLSDREIDDLLDILIAEEGA